jgi:hypothetical protein
VQRAANFRALKGFDDVAARAHKWHTFEIKKTWLLKRFLSDIEALIVSGRVAVQVDGSTVRIKGTVAA